MFLAEDFRKLLNMIEDITEADDAGTEDKPAAEDDVDDVLTDKSNDTETADTEPDSTHDLNDVLNTELPNDIQKEEVHKVTDLINYLDQFPELKKYRNENAAYDEAFYANIPVELLRDVADISDEDMDRIDQNTEMHDGGIWTHGGKIDLFGQG
jgi:hypothetical protein